MEGRRSATGIRDRNRSYAHEEALEVFQFGRMYGAEMKIMMQDTNPRKSGVTSSEAKVVFNYMCTSCGFYMQPENFSLSHDWSVRAAGKMQVVSG